MATTYSPTAPVVGDDVVLTTVLDVAYGESFTDLALDLTEYTITAVPHDSALTVGLILGDDGEPTDTFAPDVPGEYEFLANIYTEYAAPASHGGVNSGATYKTLASTAAFSVFVGATLDLVFSVPSGDGLTLRLVCHNGIVTTATLRDGTTRKAELTAEATAVAAALAAIDGVAVTALGPNLGTATGELIDAYNAHRTQAGVHDVNDTTNVYTPDNPLSNADAMAQLGTLSGVFVRHLTQASQSGSPWHLRDDTENTPIAGTPSTLAQALLVYADLRRCYIAHIAEDTSPASHTTADATNTLAAADVLTALLVAVLDVWAATAPTTPTNAEPAEYQLQTRYGFRAVS